MISQPQTVCDMQDNVLMVKQKNARQIFAENLKSLMSDKGHSQGFLHKKIGVSQSTIGRALSGETASTIDTIDAIANFYDLEPWQMLVDKLDGSNPPMLKEVSDRQMEFFAKIKEAAKEISKLDSE